MSEPHHKPPRAKTVSSKSISPKGEYDKSVPQSPSAAVDKAAREAKHEHGLWEKVKAVGRELDRDFGGEYERREDANARRKGGS